MTFAVVLVGGTTPQQRLVHDAAEAQIVIAADSGVHIARTYGLPIHVVIGDLDSALADDIAWARAQGAEILQHPRDKDATDLELALDRADSEGVDRIVAVGVEGGRLDHELCNWSTLCGARSSLIEVRTESASATILHAEKHSGLEIAGAPGDLVSLLPRFGDTSGVTTRGLRWELDDATLAASSARGISNEFTGTIASVHVGEGTLMVICPVSADTTTTDI